MQSGLWSRLGVGRSFGLLLVGLIESGLASLVAQIEIDGQKGYLSSEVAFEASAAAVCGASTLVEARDGRLVSAWYGGPDESLLDLKIWMAHRDEGHWSEPVKVADGIDDRRRRQEPCWNPVLFQPGKGPMLLFYHVGPGPENWAGMWKTSPNGGKTWSKARKLPRGKVGPVLNKPVELPGDILIYGSSTQNAGWRVHMERSRAVTRFWEKTPPLHNTLEFAAIEPTILTWPDQRIQILCRSKQKRIVESWSPNQGVSWSPVRKTSLPNPNGAIDAVTLQDGRGLLVYNHSVVTRDTLNVAISENGKDWSAVLTLENGSGAYSHPAVIQTRDGLVHVTYSVDLKRIKHVVMDPAAFVPRPMKNGFWY